MPEWLGGLFAGAVLAYFGRFIEAHFTRDRFRHEKLVDRYADLAALLARELQRGREQVATLMLGGSKDPPEIYVALQKQRDELRRELARVAFQIRMLEPQKDLVQKVEALVKSHPFIYCHLPAWGQGNFDDRLSEYQTDVGNFERAAGQLLDEIAKRHTLIRLDQHHSQPSNW